VRVLDAPLDEISRRARPYPAYLLPQGGTGLALFAAAFQGHNDAIHFARAEMTATCVDTDIDKLAKMATLYPNGWRFVISDAWEFATNAKADGDTWDVVSVDTFTGDATERSLTSLDLWCSLANLAVTATIEPGTPFWEPHGWTPQLFPRSDNVSWLVLTRD